MSDINLPYSGTLEIRGLVDIDQFYYHGGISDADTLKIGVNISGTKFYPNVQSEMIDVYTVLRNGYVKNANPSVGTKNGRKYVMDFSDKMSIRLQGIDAPELHFSPIDRGDIPIEKSGLVKLLEYRQFLSAQSVWYMTSLLVSKEQAVGSRSLNVIISTKVDNPGDAFDIYGRLVGNVLLEDQNGKINLNQWLIEKGMVFPSFYDSMSTEEISKLKRSSDEAKQKSLGIWRYYTNDLVSFNESLILPKRGEDLINLFEDIGDLNNPKIFRRQVEFEIFKKLGKHSEHNLTLYLTNKDKSSFYKTSDFLKEGKDSKKYPLADVIEENGKILMDPSEMVFTEDATVMVDRYDNEIKTWDHKFPY